MRYTVRTVDSVFEGHLTPGIEITALGTIAKRGKPTVKTLDDVLWEAQYAVLDVCDQIDLYTREASYGLGACPRIGILFKIEKFSKNKHSHIHDIGVSLWSLTCEHYFLGNPKILGR